MITEYNNIVSIKKKLTKDIYIRYLEKVIKILLKYNKELKGGNIKKWKQLL